tara:strand:+ start:696 stop:932 length:237 start_codon:yes stop_codon:yes gene_type:complete
MRKALKDKLNNIQWVSAVSSQRKAQYADIADEWLDQGWVLMKERKDWVVCTKGMRTELTRASSLEVLNHRLNKIKEQS